MSAYGKLLVIDDDPAVLRFLAAHLRQEFEVVTTDDPFAVPRMVQFDRPSAILCDIQMPGLSGSELADLLDSDIATHGVPLIYLTALVQQGPLQRYGSRIGGRPAISKSAPVGELLAFVKRVCDGASGVSGMGDSQPGPAPGHSRPVPLRTPAPAGR
jgi:CheY-like chemotaxis protein